MRARFHAPADLSLAGTGLYSVVVTSFEGMKGYDGGKGYDKGYDSKGYDSAKGYSKAGGKGPCAHRVCSRKVVIEAAWLEFAVQVMSPVGGGGYGKSDGGWKGDGGWEAPNTDVHSALQQVLFDSIIRNMGVNWNDNTVHLVYNLGKSHGGQA
eukprot:3063388-Amphidinium_carterae.1